MRVFVLEPNPIMLVGHPRQYVSSLREACAVRGIPHYLVLNSQCAPAPDAQAHFHVDGMLSFGCFENLDDKGSAFEADLNELDRRYQLVASDVLLVLTAHTQEIAGAATFLRERNSRRRCTIALNIHQIVPPASIAAEEYSLSYRRRWFRSLSRAFRACSGLWPVLSIWSSPARRLQRMLSNLAAVPVGRLPLALSPWPTILDRRPEPRLNNGQMHFAFLGDGRAEKNLNLIAACIRRYYYNAAHTSFLLQVVGVRGLDHSARCALDESLASLALSSNVTIVRDSLPPEEYHRATDAADAVLIPYDPRSYAARASSVFAEAVGIGRPLIVTAGTWMACEVARGAAAGEVFVCRPGNNRLSVSALRCSIETTRRTYQELRRHAELRASRYRRIHSGEVYLGMILRHHRTLMGGLWPTTLPY